MTNHNIFFLLLITSSESFTDTIYKETFKEKDLKPLSFVQPKYPSAARPVTISTTTLPIVSTPSWFQTVLVPSNVDVE